MNWAAPLNKPSEPHHLTNIMVRLIACIKDLNDTEGNVIDGYEVESHGYLPASPPFLGTRMREFGCTYTLPRMISRITVLRALSAYSWQPAALPLLRRNTGVIENANEGE